MLIILFHFTVWDSKPEKQGSPINWVELKTSAEIRGQHDVDNFHRKLMKYWIQSFLLGVPKIIVGFRSRDGILLDVQEIETHKIPETVNARPNPSWNADMCVNFAAEFLECTSLPLLRSRYPDTLEFASFELTSSFSMTGLTQTINDEGVWRICRQPRSPVIQVYRVEETGHGDILSDAFKDWRIKLSLQPPSS